jgi:hypothetical protein
VLNLASVFAAGVIYNDVKVETEYSKRRPNSERST